MKTDRQTDSKEQIAEVLSGNPVEVANLTTKPKPVMRQVIGEVETFGTAPLNPNATVTEFVYSHEAELAKRLGPYGFNHPV